MPYKGGFTQRTHLYKVKTALTVVHAHQLTLCWGNEDREATRGLCVLFIVQCLHHKSSVTGLNGFTLAGTREGLFAMPRQINAYT